MTFNVVLGALLVFTAGAGYIDFRTGFIPNRLVLFGFVAGAALSAAVHIAARGFLQGLAAALLSVVIGTVACGLVPLLLYRYDALGGGDVKLLAAVGAYVGPAIGLETLFYALTAAAVYAPIKLVYQGRFFVVLVNSAGLLLNPILPRHKRRSPPPEALTTLRFGPAVFAGACVSALLHWNG